MEGGSERSSGRRDQMKERGKEMREGGKVWLDVEQDESEVNR